MSDPIRCPDCGAENAADAATCVQCNFPIHGPGAALAAPAPASDPPAAAATPRPLPPRPHRPRPPRPEGASQSLTVWLFVGGFAALLVIYMAVKANVERVSTPVEGSSVEQQKMADQLIALIAQDSTIVDNRVALGDLYYDTANWSEAIVQYRAATRMDSSRITALVDLGVCYYNLGDTEHAAHLFQLGLQRDPHQPIALFNLGIVSERHEEYDASLSYFHRALESSPPESMREQLMQAIQRVQQKTGRPAPPIAPTR